MNKTSQEQFQRIVGQRVKLAREDASLSQDESILRKACSEKRKGPMQFTLARPWVRFRAGLEPNGLRASQE